MSTRINYGILGAGHLGGFHAQQLKNISGVNVVGVFDININNAKRVAQQYGVPVFQSPEKLLSLCNAVSITTPATNHFDSTLLALEHNCHVFIEKPFTRNVNEAQQLIELKKNKKLKIQIGHIERFNPAFLAFLKSSPNPSFIESHRLCSFNERGLDVDVVLDLMIHDIDLCLVLVGSKLKKISAFGSPILTSSIDIANARLEFANNTTVNLTASRISLKQMRQMRIFQKRSYSVIDFQKPELNTWQINKKGSLSNKKPALINTNALFEELSSFVVSINNNTPVIIGAEEGLNALLVASKIQQKIEEQNK
tara:strand:- start:1518 stop:2447 length:930 start_codon:yes stop_codon:yes gene_type:complete